MPLPPIPHGNAGAGTGTGGFVDPGNIAPPAGGSLPPIPDKGVVGGAALPPIPGTGNGGFVAPGSGNGGFGAPMSAPAKSGGGLLGFVEHLGSDAKNAIEGLPTGVATVAGAAAHDFNKATGSVLGAWSTKDLTGGLFGKPASSKGGYELPAIGKAVGHSYAQTYGPLAHGDVNGFLHNLYAHPLGPILDVATVLTGGAGAAAKVGGALEKAGAI